MYPMDCYKLDAPTAMNSVRPGADTVLYWSGAVNHETVDMYYSLIGDVPRSCGTTPTPTLPIPRIR